MNSTYNLCKMALCYALLVLGATIQISLPTPFYAMHITLQLGFALIMGALLTLSQTTLVMTTYIVSGLLGLPVFAQGGGISYILRPTFGFVLGIAAAAIVVSATQKATRISLAKSVWLSLFIYYLFGIFYYLFATRLLLNTPVPLSIVLINCFAISIIPDGLISVSALAIIHRLKPYIR